MLAIALCAIAAAAFAYACVAKTWLYNPRNTNLTEVGFGLLSNYYCPPGLGGAVGECRGQSNRELVEDWAKQLAEFKKAAEGDPTNPAVSNAYTEAKRELRAPPSFPIWGYVTLGALAIAALSLVTCAVLGLLKKRILWPMMPTTSALLGTAIGLVTGCVFIAMKPGPPGFVGTGMGFYAFGAGVLCSIGGAIMINKLLRPTDPDLLADAMDPDQY